MKIVHAKSQHPTCTSVQVQLGAQIHSGPNSNFESNKMSFYTVNVPLQYVLHKTACACVINYRWAYVFYVVTADEWPALHVIVHSEGVWVKESSAEFQYLQVKRA